MIRCIAFGLKPGIDGTLGVAGEVSLDAEATVGVTGELLYSSYLNFIFISIFFAV